jgi:acyl carrier protein
MVSDSINASLRSWIRKELLVDRPDINLDDETELLRSGLIDSLDIMRLVLFMEEEFGITIPEDEVLPAGFRKVSTIAEVVRRHLPQPQ